jgi:acetyl esterase/lipase
MKKILFFMLSFLISTLKLSAQQEAFNMDLWPNGLPNSNGIDQSQPYDDSKQNFKPSIRVFLPDADKATGLAVVCCPGGGYSHLAMDHEGYEWASFFNERGIALIVLKYRMPHANPDVPISDAKEALRVVRENAQKWNIDPQKVGIMGSSAGGHLASTVSTHSDMLTAPAFQILFYPVITMDPAFTHLGSHNNLLGKNAKKKQEMLFSNDAQVNRTTPRAWIALSDDDTVVLPANGFNYYFECYRHDVEASLHVYPSGGHGWGIRPAFRFHTEMMAELKAWLQSF